MKPMLFIGASKLAKEPTATPSGAHVAKLLDQLGIVAAMQSKVIHRPALDGGAELVAKGEAELGIYPTSEVVHVKGVTVVGPLPAALQLKTIYGAAVVKTSAVSDAARMLPPLRTVSTRIRPPACSSTRAPIASRLGGRPTSRSIGRSEDESVYA